VAERHAIVTGISRGFGNAVARALVAGEWRVIGDARDADALAGLGDGITAVPGDINDERHLRDLVDHAPRIDLLVNNAGALGPSPLPRLVDMNTDELVELFRVNTAAQLRLVQLALPRMRAGGCVINITSDAAVEHYPGWGAYGATKAALDLLTGVLAEEVSGIRFYALDPGDLRTDMHQAAFPGEDISDRPLPETVVPGFLRLLDDDLPSGRYKAADLVPAPVGP
jgi:NAD(P)-dependent dehydrogenase (short-subunit alcohol dehydrogenase family)